MTAGAAQQVLRLGRHSFTPDQRLVMGIVNRTPDSFYDRGATWDTGAAMARVHAVVAEGADILDIGGVAAAPGTPVDVAEEIRRSVPFVAAVRAAYPDLVISVDTWRHEVGREACRAGADLLNDTWGGQDRQLAEVAAEFGAGLICAHAGDQAPRTRPFRVAYDDVMADVLDRTLAQAARATAAGVEPARILIDAGARLRQEHLAVTGDHPAAGRDGGDRLAGAGVPVQQGLHRGDAERSAGPAADRDAGHHGHLRLAGRPRVPGAPGPRDPGGAGHGVGDPG